MPKKWVYTGTNLDTGKKYFSLETVQEQKPTELPGIDQLPPPGLEGVKLTTEKPILPVEGSGIKGERFVPPTFIAKSAEALEDKEK